MAVLYPDVLGDMVDARQRFEADGVQYVEQVSPSVIPPGGVARLDFWLQSCWEASVHLNLAIAWRRGVDIRLPEASLDVPLHPAEVAHLVIPIQAGPDLLPDTYRLSLRLKARPDMRCQRIRSREGSGALADSLLPYTVGLGLANSIGVGYSTTPRDRLEMSVRVERRGATSPSGDAPQEDCDLTPSLISHWILDDMVPQGRAQTWVNDRRPYILPGLELPLLSRVLMDETYERFERCGLELEIPEAMFVTKVLAWTARYFLQNPAWQDGLLVPAYALAFRHDLPTDNPSLLVARADYARLVRLASSATCGLLRRRLARDPWPAEELRAVGQFVSHRLEASYPLAVEFLYLPLVLGGLLVGRDLILPGESLEESYELIALAREKRAAALAENPELQDLLAKLLEEAT